MTDDDILSASTRLHDESEDEPVVRGRGRPVGDREAKRAELLQAAISLIAQEGLAGASLRKVAQRAGCTTGAVTYYFENKEAMVAAIAESLFDQSDRVLGKGRDTIDLAAGFQRWFGMKSGDSDSWLAGFQLLAYARHKPEFAAIYERRYRQYREALTSMLEKGQEEGQIRTDIPADLLADQICAMGDGWMMMLPIEPKRFKPARVKALLEATIALISPPAPQAGATPRAKRRAS